MREANDRRADRDDLARLRRDPTDDAVGVGPKRRIVERVARERDRAVGAHGRARALGRRPRAPCRNRRSPPSPASRASSCAALPLRPDRARRSRNSVRPPPLRAASGNRRRRAAPAHRPHGQRARVDEPLRDLAGNAKGKIALDARLDDPGQHLRLLARRIMRFARPAPASASLPRRLRILIAPGNDERRAERRAESQATSWLRSPGWARAAVGLASARRAKSTASSGSRLGAMIVRTCAISVGSMDDDAGLQRHASRARADRPGPNSPAAWPSAIASASIAAHLWR